jgi:gamma-glutamyl-gamma-aminobutyrate hydrolase PuuD
VEGDTGDTGPYLEALRRVGVEVVFGAPLDEVSGLMLMGGTDVNPARYGEARLPVTEDPDDARDLLELRLIGEALERDLPILAICRGMQVLNVQHGGSLIQDIAGHVQPKGDKSLNAHAIEIVAGTKLAGIAGGLKSQVNSRHHQAVARVGEGLVVSARAEDGVIEGLERTDKKFVVGVQWHPENQVDWGRLFEEFARVTTGGDGIAVGRREAHLAGLGDAKGRARRTHGSRSRHSLVYSGRISPARARGCTGNSPARIVASSFAVARHED